MSSLKFFEKIEVKVENFHGCRHILLNTGFGSVPEESFVCKKCSALRI